MNWEALITEHLARRPGMQPRDIYKLLYQGMRGPEHIITSAQGFSERLREEWDGLDPANDDKGSDDPLCESIRPDGGLRRVNLRPYKAQGGSLEALAAACLETGRRAWESQAEIQRIWQALAAGYAAAPPPGLSGEDFIPFTRWLEGQAFPPVHHSEAYRSLYRPAYRLVAAELCPLENSSQV